MASSLAAAVSGTVLMVGGLACLLVGLVVASTFGVLVAWRALHPMVQLLDRRRRFVADASHELRAPLTRLHVRGQLLLRRAEELPEPLVTELRRMVAGTRELGEVLDDMLRTARLWSDAPGSERVDLDAVATDLLAAEAGRLAERKLVAVLRVGPEPLVVLGVKPALRRMLSALLDNAIGHTPPQGRITVSIATVDHGRTVELVVGDTGVGFDPVQHRTMFDRFSRGAAGQGQRFGIGLALTREVVESHGGTIAGVGQPGRGARFIVRLPAAPPRRPSKNILRSVHNHRCRCAAVAAHASIGGTCRDASAVDRADLDSVVHTPAGPPLWP
ncbi:sensor histidine kinase [Phytohabitans rumicis]|uniref:sensor histidine kinase n=1 Tax=Phytohabitans rumicis TaxID=1076125 RepID=UPI0015638ACF|nr:HAMP domain-containing sensor histidine kinase [Phytohabitans rumicis]